MSLDIIAKEIKNFEEKIVLVYAFNTTGKTRLSVAFKNATKDENTGKHSGVYYNAFSEDLFNWDNENVLLNITKSSLNKFHASFTEQEVMYKLEQYKPRYNFYFNPHANPEDGFQSVVFYVGEDEDTPIKISRGEERIFVWCLFLAMFEVEGWADEQNAHFFIDDPVSSLDDHNIFITATTLYDLIEKHFKSRKIILTTHHIGLYSILSNWLTRGEKSSKFKKTIQENVNGVLKEKTVSIVKKLILNRKNENVLLEPIKNSVFLYHLHLLQTLDKADKENNLVTFHFALLRQALENIASFLGVGQFSYVLKQIGIEDSAEVSNILNVLAHEKVYRYQTDKMGEDSEKMFKRIFQNLKDKYQFVLRSE